jgi:hypothetical protein
VIPPLFGGHSLKVGDHVRAVDGPRLGQEGPIAMSRWQGATMHREISGEIFEVDGLHRMNASSLFGLTTVRWYSDSRTTRYRVDDLRDAPSRPDNWSFRFADDL